MLLFSSFFFINTATSEIYTLSLHDALPISRVPGQLGRDAVIRVAPDGERQDHHPRAQRADLGDQLHARSEEHTSELQSPVHLVCRLLLEKKKKHSSVPTLPRRTRTRKSDVK